MSDHVYLEAHRVPAILERLNTAAPNGVPSKSLRILTGFNPARGHWVKFKTNEGGWSEPIYGDDDPYRDNPTPMEG